MRLWLAHIVTCGIISPKISTKIVGPSQKHFSAISAFHCLNLRPSRVSPLAGCQTHYESRQCRKPECTLLSLCPSSDLGVEWVQRHPHLLYCSHLGVVSLCGTSTDLTLMKTWQKEKVWNHPFSLFLSQLSPECQMQREELLDLFMEEVI